MTWQGHLALAYRRDGDRTVAHDRHAGPLRVLKALYPEGERICHHVLVHPPGGIAGGDRLDIEATLGAGTHTLITTPGAARFYRSAGADALQSARITLGTDARLEWLPLESIAHSGCRATNALAFELAPGAQLLGWDLLALGLPASEAPFAAGHFEQRIAWPGVWLERGRVDAVDSRLRTSALGLAGRDVLACAWFAAGSAWSDAQRERLLDAARAVGTDGVLAGATAPDARLVVVRVLGHRVEPAMAHVAAVRAAWRREAWGLDAIPPRVWRT